MRCSFPQTRLVNGSYVTHSCGNCRACRRNKAREWGFRSYVESLSYDSSIFLSLTYDDEHIPIGPKGFPTLRKADTQTFWKDFRYYVGECRYLLSGEYGEHTHRPHYHAVVFGVDLDNPVFYDKFYSPRKKAWIARCKAWKFGEVCIGNVTVGSCQYVAKYVVKRKTGRAGQAYYEKYGIEPEFATMSRRPGLGYDYLKENESLIKRHGYVMIKGHKTPLSRYYIDKLYDKESDEYELFKMDRAKKMAEASKRFIQNRDIGRFDVAKYMKMYLEQQEINLEKQENEFSK